MTPNSYITVNDIARELDCCKATVTGEYRDNELPDIIGRAGRSLLWSREQLPSIRYAIERRRARQFNRTPLSQLAAASI